MDNLEKKIKTRLILIEETLNSVLPKVEERPNILNAAIRWSVEGGGKRIRPLICLAAAEAVGGSVNDAIMPACAIELLHTYTLVHDDLPAMDGDRERRGKASVWAKFGEANGILAGDALQALAFATATRAPRCAAEIVKELALRSIGVVAGQVEDLTLERSGTPNENTIAYVYDHKTADLFVAAAAMGALAANASPCHVESLRTYARNLGLAFQHRDDILDKDSPFPPAETERRIQTLTSTAIAALNDLPGDTTLLSALAEKLISRVK